MDSAQNQLDQLLFAVLPYFVVVAFFALLAARRYRVPPFSAPPSAPASGARPPYFGERVLFGYGILVILAGHVLAFLIPQQILLWNNEPVRRYVLEVSALVFALMTAVGLILTATRCLFNAQLRRDTRLADWMLYLLLVVQIGNGIYVALFYPWGSSWYATSMVPYLRSLFRLEPDVQHITGMPHEVKMHIASAYLLLLILPFTRLMRPFLIAETEPVRKNVARPLITALLLVGLGFSGLALIPRLQAAHLAGNNQGYEPAQPIAFSHRLHTGDLQISCLYCHFGAEKSRHAGLPPATVCMNCHRFVSAPLQLVRAEYESARQEKRPARTLVTADLQKLYDALGLNDKLQPDPAKTPSPIHWTKVHNLPAFAHFDHRAHVNAGVSCERCHGAVETMERVRQVEDLSMGWCVNCHRDVNTNGLAGKLVNASNDCATCHH
jgi:respiratory nitrate reductase gamma subunit